MTSCGSGLAEQPFARGVPALEKSWEHRPSAAPSIGVWIGAIAEGVAPPVGEQAEAGTMNEREQAAVNALSGELTPFGHRTCARVYYADTDFSGVVYHARYLEFLERGRSDFLRLQGVKHTELASGVDGEPVAWIVRRMDIVWRQPARMDDVIAIDTATERMSGARVFMTQRVHRNGTTLLEAKVEVAIVGRDGRPRRFPKSWIDAFMPSADAGDRA
jgi:acyl-CoA thioester hydrolase